MQTETKNVTGFIVVRLPELNTGEDLSEWSGIRQAPHLDSIYYAGFERMAWNEIEADYYNDTLTEKVAGLREQITGKQAGTNSIEVCQNPQVTRELLAYSNSLRAVNEIICVSSQTTNNLQGSVRVASRQLLFLGYDVVWSGMWSLLLNGIFRHKSYFKPWEDKLNQYGLFDIDTCVEEYARTYENVSHLGGCEPMPIDTPSLDLNEINALAIFRLNYFI